MKILPCGLIVKIISVPQVLDLDLQVCGLGQKVLSSSARVIFNSIEWHQRNLWIVIPTKSNPSTFSNQGPRGKKIHLQPS